MADLQEISLYFHIPFCTKKCPYCHFYVVPNQSAYHTLLKEGLILEWETKKDTLQGYKVASIYFGGGTPSLFAPKGIADLLEMIRKSGISLKDTCEITMEANPEGGSRSFFQEVLSSGVNRLSLGVQSLDDRSLQTLDRTHSAQKAKEVILEARKGGFKNLSIDLMYDLPDQTESSWQYTLEQIKELEIEHLSLYNLTIEPHTTFDRKKKELTLPSPQSSLRMLEKGVEMFENLGLKRYEISAFAKPGHKSIHNYGYWTGRPFLGFGPSACSFFAGERFRNLANLQKYVSALRQGLSPEDFREKLPYPENIKEQFLVRLRLLEGAPFDPSWPSEMKQTIENLTKQNLLHREGDMIQLTTRGLLFHDTIATEIL